jgi:hypothetical protein
MMGVVTEPWPYVWVVYGATTLSLGAYVVSLWVRLRPPREN